MLASHHPQVRARRVLQADVGSLRGGADAFWSYSKPQGARTTSRCGSRRLGIDSIYPYRAHTAEEPVDDGPRGRCYGPVNSLHLRGEAGGKRVNVSALKGFQARFIPRERGFFHLSTVSKHTRQSTYRLLYYIYNRLSSTGVRARHARGSANPPHTRRAHPTLGEPTPHSGKRGTL